MKALLLLLALAVGCGRWVRPAPARSYDPSVPCGATRLLVEYHRPSGRAKGEHAPVVLFEPRILRKEVLDRGLVPYLGYRGFPVWVVYAEAPGGAGAVELGRCFARAVEGIAGVTKSRVTVGGVSLGAPVVALGARAGPVRRIFFYAAGLDYDYPGSLVEARVPLATACAACAPWLSGVAPEAPRVDLADVRVPVLFVNGKIDGVAPSESVYPVYERYGGAKRLVLVGRENLLPDVDHWGMLSGDEEAGFEIVADWLESE